LADHYIVIGNNEAVSIINVLSPEIPGWVILRRSYFTSSDYTFFPEWSISALSEQEKN